MPSILPLLKLLMSVCSSTCSLLRLDYRSHTQSHCSLITKLHLHCQKTHTSMLAQSTSIPNITTSKNAQTTVTFMSLMCQQGTTLPIFSLSPCLALPSSTYTNLVFTRKLSFPFVEEYSNVFVFESIYYLSHSIPFSSCCSTSFCFQSIFLTTFPIKPFGLWDEESWDYHLRYHIEFTLQILKNWHPLPTLVVDWNE